MLSESAYNNPSTSFGRLPTKLSESLKALKGDTELSASLGNRFIRWFLEVKEHERKDMAERAPDIDLDKDLPSVLHCQKLYLDLL